MFRCSTCTDVLLIHCVLLETFLTCLWSVMLILLKTTQKTCEQQNLCHLSQAGLLSWVYCKGFISIVALSNITRYVPDIALIRNKLCANDDYWMLSLASWRQNQYLSCVTKKVCYYHHLMLPVTWVKFWRISEKMCLFEKFVNNTL